MALPEDIAALAEKIVNTLTHTFYQHPDKIDTASGVYDCDCNGFTAYLLNTLAPQNLAAIPKNTEPGHTESRPRAFEYYDFFASLTAQSTGGWSRIHLLSDARRGDTMAWRAPTLKKGENTGHVLSLAETPKLDASGAFYVARVYDSASGAQFSTTPALRRRETRGSVQASSISRSMAMAVPSPICSRRPSPLNIPIVPSRSDARG